MKNNDPFSQFKAAQREGWGLFAPLESLTTPAAAKLVEFAEIKPGQRVLDCACGTGVVAITAARKGAQVKGLDLAPALIERAEANSIMAQTEIEFTEGDVEALPYVDASFDVVLSQFGHMFAPRPEVAISEMLRVLKPGGRIAFSTWPPDHFVGKLFFLGSKFSPPPPGTAAPAAWGDPVTIRERLGGVVEDLMFDRGQIWLSVLSPQHARDLFERTAAPLVKLVSDLKNEPVKLAQFRSELEELIDFYAKDNVMQQHFLLSRATKI